MIKKYLEQEGERVTEFSQLREGEIYVAVHHEGYIGFIMPEAPSHEYPFVVLNGERIFEVESERHPGKVRVVNSYPIDDISIEHEEMGVFRPLKGSELRKTLEEQLCPEETELVA